MNKTHRGLHPRVKVDEYTSKGWWSDETIDHVFRVQVRTRGDELAVVDPANRSELSGGDPRRLSWNQLESEVISLAARFTEAGLGRGDVLGVQMPNTVELVEVHLAAWSLGIVVSPLPMQYREREVEGMANQAAFAAFVTVPSFGDRFPATEIAAIRSRIASLRSVFAYAPESELPAELPTGVVGLSPRAATESQRSALDRRNTEDPNDPNDAMTICWTSGTESEPKGVPRSHYE